MTQVKVERGTCQVCGCTNARACPGGCDWRNKEHTICSRCELPVEEGAKNPGIPGVEAAR